MICETKQEDKMGRNKKQLDITNGAYILNLKAKDLKPYMCTGKAYPLKNKAKIKMYSGMYPYSLDLIHLYKISKRDFYVKDNRLYYDAVINVSFNDDYKEYKLILQPFHKRKKQCKYKIMLTKSLPKDFSISFSIKVKKDGVKASTDFMFCKPMEYLKKIVLNRKYAKEITQYNDTTSNFNNKLIKQTIKIKKKKETLRKIAYADSFLVDGVKVNGKITSGVKYVKFKRSGSKAKGGSCLFVREDILDTMKVWGRMGLVFKPDEEYDIASMAAYESLTTSAIIKTISIQPDEILIIPDYTEHFTSPASVMTIINGVPTVNNVDDYKHSVDIWDGQSLLDESFFEHENSNVDNLINSIFPQLEEKPRKPKGMMLLRNRFFKSCAFNCKIQKFFKDVDIVHDRIRNIDLDAKKIKLIITPNSLKIFKFKNKIGSGTDAECYQYWLDNISSYFGVCKSEKPSKYGENHQMSYQMVNTLDLCKDEVCELMKTSTDYIMSIKNDFVALREHLKNSTNEAKDFLYNIIPINADIQYTDWFIDGVKKNEADKLKKKLSKGKILIPNSDYMILFSNGYEMLLTAKTGIDPVKSLHNGKQVYCSRFEDKEYLCGFRNPHICSGNVLYVQNVEHQEFKEWFNLTDNIIVINNFDNDTFARLQGADADSDSCWISDYPLLVSKAKECLKFPTPICNVPLAKKLRPEDAQNCYEVDNCISNNLIGRIVNMSQILNSFYWDLKSKGADDKTLNAIYDEVSKLSSLSQLEIDKSKKYFETSFLDMRQVLADIKDSNDLKDKDGNSILYETNKKLKYNYSDNEKEKYNVLFKNRDKFTDKEFEDKFDSLMYKDKILMIRPIFFKALGNKKDNSNKFKYQHFHCPMDYVQDVIKQEIKNANIIKAENRIALIDIFIQKNDCEANRHQAPKIIELVNEANKRLKAIKADKYRNKDDDYVLQQTIKNDLINELGKLSVNKYTIVHIANMVYNDKSTKYKNVNGDIIEVKLSKIKGLLFNSLWKAQKETMIEAIKTFSIAKNEVA